MIVHQVWGGGVGEDVSIRGLLDVMHSFAVKDHALNAALASGQRGPGPGLVPQHPGVVTQLHLGLVGFVYHSAALKQNLRN